jgi:hypothetical protein
MTPSKNSYVLYSVAILLTLILPGAVYAQGATAVLMGQYNNSRTGANMNETILTPANVSAATFGLLFTQPVDANVFAQPLYVPGLTVNGAVHNVTYVATLNNSVYAFDADTSQPALWHTKLGTPVAVGTSTEPTVGILSTPVIDLNLKAIFVVAFAMENGSPVYRLHALNLLTGTNMANIALGGAVSGTGDNSQANKPCTSWNGGTVAPPCVPFVAAEELQRSALLEGAASPTIYVAFGALGGEEITESYHGWLLGYQFASGAFTQKMIFTTTQMATQTGLACSGKSLPMNQCGHGAGIWMSGRGPAMDGTGVYVVTGNGGYGGPGTGNWGESVLRLSGSGSVADSFTPSSVLQLNAADMDLCDGGTILLTSANATTPNLILAAGKTGSVYVMNRAAMGGMTTNNAGAIQTFVATEACGDGPGRQGCYEVHNPALWNRPGGAATLYVWAQGDVLRVWDLNSTTNNFTPDANQGTLTAQNYPGGGLAISANGSADGILWAIVPTTVGSQTQGSLYAFDAANVGTPLWTSTDYWFPTKFTIPTIVNGKVYVPTSASPSGAITASSPQLLVYGLCTNCAQAQP